MTRARTRLVFFGTPDLAADVLRALHEAGHEVVLVVTRPPRRRSRRGAPTPSPVAKAANALGLPVTWDAADALSIAADLAVVIAYGEFIREAVANERCTVNLHFSLLPRWRGAAPVERAILAGDTRTGVCLIDIAPEIDTGDVYSRAETAIRPDENATQLRNRLCALGIDLIVEALREGFGEPEPQQGESTWADKLTTDELRIDWSNTAEHAMRKVRVGGAWTMFRGRRFKIVRAVKAVRALTADHEAPVEAAVPAQIVVSSAPAGTATSGAKPKVLVGTAEGCLELLEVQAEGRKATAASQWCLGARLEAGERFDT